MADTQGLTAMELERARRIEENKARMALLGLTQVGLLQDSAARRATRPTFPCHEPHRPALRSPRLPLLLAMH